MSNKLLIYRKKKPEFNSIENVFNAVLKYIEVSKIELPYVSTGFNNRLKNILFIRKQKSKLNHITGNDHYLAFGLIKQTIVLTIHDIEILKRSQGLKYYILKKLWFDWPIKKSAVVTTISEFSKKEILSLNNYRTPIIVIHNPLTLPLKFQEKVFNKKLPNILHIGTKKNKNLSRLIKILNGIHCHLTIIGELTPKQKELLTKNKIIYSEKYQINEHEIIREYINCDIVAFISTYEGFGLPIIEAQAIGRVIITSNIASMPEVAGEGALLIDPYDNESIKNGILQLIKSPKLRADLIQKGRENIKRFEPEKIAEKYNQLYQNIISDQ